MQIELYNDKWLQPHHEVVKTKSTIVNRPSMEIDAIAFESHPIPIIPTMEVLNKEYNTPRTTSEINTDPETTLAQHTLHSKIECSVDKLLFIQYTPAGTMRRRWYLVQVDLDASKSICSTYIKDLSYYCHFLAKHPNDKNKSDEYSRWWPDWYKYSRDSITSDIVFGDRILFRPSQQPNADKYIQ